MTSKMNTPDTPNYSTRELIELSMLHAMGFLDDDEHARFERSFTATSPAIQAHVRREQTRLAMQLAQIDHLLPHVEPPADLRSAALERVRRAMVESLTEEGVPEEQEAGLSAFAPALLPSRRVSPLWRAGAVGFATAAVVFGFTTLRMAGQYDELKAMMSNNVLTDQTLASLGGAFQDVLFNPHTRHVAFAPRSGDVQGVAVLLMDPESGTAYLLCRKLPTDDGRQYKLVVVDDNGQVAQQLTAFASTSGLTALPVTVRVSPAQRLAILPPADTGDGDPAAILTTDQMGS